MAEKKRKRLEERSDDRRLNKKMAIESPLQTIKVSVIDNGDEWVPVLGKGSLNFRRN